MEVDEEEFEVQAESADAPVESDAAAGPHTPMDQHHLASPAQAVVDLDGEIHRGKSAVAAIVVDQPFLF